MPNFLKPVTVNGATLGPLSSATPAADGTAAAGTGTASSRDDHVHPAASAISSFATLLKLGAC